MPYSNVTVVIPAYRAESTIVRAVESVLTQEECDARILVIVDGVLDRTGELLKRYSSDGVQVVTHADNQGAQRSRNEGLMLSQSEFTMFLDADDFLEGPLLAGLVDAMRRTDADVGFGPIQISREGSGLRDPKFIPDYRSSSDLFLSWFVDNRYVTPCSVLWRTAYLRSIGGWDPDIERNQDGEVVLRAVLSGAQFAISDRGCGIYVKAAVPASVTSRSDNLSSLLKVSDKILNLRSSVVSDDVKRRACGAHNYMIASRCYESDRDDLAREALRRSRELGFRGHRGPLIHRIVARAIGLRLKTKLVTRLKRARRLLRPQ